MQDHPNARPGPYRHYKGGRYTLLHLARHSESEVWLAIYRAETDGSLWARPLSMWLETVSIDGGTVPRFAPD